MSTQKAVSANPQRNNGATVKFGGNVDSSNTVTNVRDGRDDALFDGYGAKVTLEQATLAASGTFAYKQVPGEYVAKVLGAKINGQTNTFLRSGARYDAYKNPAVLETTRALGSGAYTSWDYETGAITKDASAGTLISFGADNAARPTNAIPGELVYRTGAPLPEQDDYKPRTGP